MTTSNLINLLHSLNSFIINDEFQEAIKLISENPEDRDTLLSRMVDISINLNKVDMFSYASRQIFFFEPYFSSFATSAFLNACSSGHKEIIDFILNDIDSTSYDTLKNFSSCFFINKYIVNTNIENPSDSFYKSFFYRSLEKAIANKHYDIAKNILITTPIKYAEDYLNFIIPADNLDLFQLFDVQCKKNFIQNPIYKKAYINLIDYFKSYNIAKFMIEETFDLTNTFNINLFENSQLEIFAQQYINSIQLYHQLSNKLDKKITKLPKLKI